MEPSEYKRECTRRALSVMRAWASPEGDDVSLAIHEAQMIIEADGEPDRLLTGLVNLSGYLLVLLEGKGEEMSSVLDHVDRKISET
jgi:hypothetical protein